MDKLATAQKRDCWICLYSDTSIILTSVNSGKIVQNIETYLNLSIIIPSFENDSPVSCCSYCYESAQQLTLLEEQIVKIHREISDLSLLFSKKVLERRSRVKNNKDKIENQLTDQCLAIHKTNDGHSGLAIENVVIVKKEVGETVSNIIPSEEKIKNDDLVTDLWYSTIYEHENVNNDDSDIVNPSEDDIDIKYSYNKTTTTAVDTVKRQIDPNQLIISTANTQCQPKPTSMAELLETVKMPIIQLKRIQPCISRTSPNGEHKKDVNDFHNLSENLSPAQPLRGLKAVNPTQIKTGRKIIEKHLRKSCNCNTFTCNFCSNSIKSAPTLKSHEKLHSEEKPFRCYSSEKSFKTSSDLKFPENSVHSADRPYKCSFCVKSFLAPTLLKIHERFHTDERPFTCLLCGQTFRSADVLVKHEIIHSEQKPCKCLFCEKSFTNSHNLKVHEKNIHSEGRPYKCSFCNKTFTIPSTLKAHERFHTGEKPFKCSFCSKSFFSSSDRRRHEQIHTGERPHKCSICEETFQRKEFLTLHQNRMHGGRTEEFILP